MVTNHTQFILSRDFHHNLYRICGTFSLRSAKDLNSDYGPVMRMLLKADDDAKILFVSFTQSLYMLFTKTLTHWETYFLGVKFKIALIYQKDQKFFRHMKIKWCEK
jgi:hypothetical protein